MLPLFDNKLHQVDTETPLPYRYEGLWKVTAKNSREGRALEKILHTHFELRRMKKANGNYSEWFRVSFEEVQSFLNSTGFVIRQLSIEEVEEIHKRAESSASTDETSEFNEEKALIYDQEKEMAKPPEMFKQKFFLVKVGGKVQKITTPKSIPRQMVS